MKNKLWFFLFFAPFLGFSLAGINIYYQLAIWKYAGPSVEFQVSPGERFSSINYRLHKKNLIKNPKIFHRYAQFNHLIKKIKQGHFTIKTNSNMISVIDTLVTSKGKTLKITIPEGKNIFEIAKLFEKKGITKKDDFIKYAKDPLFMKELGINAQRVEGHLFPDTYHFSKNTNAKYVIRKMVNIFNKKFSQLDISHSDLTKNEIITLASIVEKETGAAFERVIISGVFHNRLKKKMRLQSDPTTIYGIFEKFNGNLRKSHLLAKTPYNTYKMSGLPLGPISNPGLESLKAVISPSKHNFLYFVSKNDGTHIFSKTYKDHRKAVQIWQKNSKNRKGKSWRDLKK